MCLSSTAQQLTVDTIRREDRRSVLIDHKRCFRTSERCGHHRACCSASLDYLSQRSHTSITPHSASVHHPEQLSTFFFKKNKSLAKLVVGSAVTPLLRLHPALVCLSWLASVAWVAWEKKTLHLPCGNHHTLECCGFWIVELDLHLTTLDDI